MIIKSPIGSVIQRVHQHIGLKQVLPENQPVAIKCPQCKTEFGQFEMICPHCGYDLRGKWNPSHGHASQRVALPGIGQLKIVLPDMRKVWMTMIGVPFFIGLVWLLVWFVRHIFRP
jgi:hypothetical protein